MRAVLILICFASCTAIFSKKASVTKDEAIKKAEQFIKDNGYTTFRADKSKLSYELLDNRYNNIDSVLKKRFNTLLPIAFCIIDETDSWYVGFLSSGIDITKLTRKELQTNLSGRAVVVNKNGNEIYLAHKDPLFSYFKKLKSR